MKKTYLIIGFLGLAFTSCIESETSSDARHIIENNTGNALSVIRYHKFNKIDTLPSKTIDTLTILSNDYSLEYSGSSSMGSSGMFEYDKYYDSVQVIYRDTFMITHYPVNTNKLVKPILTYNSPFWVSQSNSLGNNAHLNTYTYSFNLEDENEAILKGDKIK